MWDLGLNTALLKESSLPIIHLELSFLCFLPDLVNVTKGDFSVHRPLLSLAVKLYDLCLSRVPL